MEIKKYTFSNNFKIIYGQNQEINRLQENLRDIIRDIETLLSSSGIILVENSDLSPVEKQFLYIDSGTLSLLTPSKRVLGIVLRAQGGNFVAQTQGIVEIDTALQKPDNFENNDAFLKISDNLIKLY